jgi:hypothetical protein
MYHSTLLRGAVSSTGYSYMVATHWTGVQDLSLSTILQQDLLRKTLDPPLVPAWGALLACLTGLVTLTSTLIYNLHYSTYTRVPGSVSIHILRTVVLDYGELLALLVIPTWLLHWFPRFESLSNCVPLAWNLPLSARYLQYVAAPLLVPARGALVVVACQGLPGHAHSLTSTHMYGYLLYIHTCDGKCEQS